MFKLNIEMKPRIELGNLINFIADHRRITYMEAERLVPAIYFEGGVISEFDEKDWCREVVEEMHRRGIGSLEVYQD